MLLKKIIGFPSLNLQQLACKMKFKSIPLLDGKVIVNQNNSSKAINVIYEHDKEKLDIPISFTGGSFSISQSILNHAAIFNTSQGQALAVITGGNRCSNILYCRLDHLPKLNPGHTDFLWEPVQIYVLSHTMQPENDTLIVQDIWKKEYSIELKPLPD